MNYLFESLISHLDSQKACSVWGEVKRIGGNQISVSGVRPSRCVFFSSASVYLFHRESASSVSLFGPARFFWTPFVFGLIRNIYHSNFKKLETSSFSCHIMASI
jgi:hypothetical protein